MGFQCPKPETRRGPSPTSITEIKLADIEILASLGKIHLSQNLNQQCFLGDGLSAAAQFADDEFDVWDREDYGPTTLIEKRRNSFVTGR